MGKKSKFNNRGGCWFNFDPNSKKSPQTHGSARVSKTDYWVNCWLKAPKGCPKTKKAIKQLVAAMQEEITEKGGCPVLSLTFKKK